LYWKLKDIGKYRFYSRNTIPLFLEMRICDAAAAGSSSFSDRVRVVFTHKTQIGKITPQQKKPQQNTRLPVLFQQKKQNGLYRYPVLRQPDKICIFYFRRH
jgi:hypothetical protein